MLHSTLRLAVLIDGDNVAAKYADAVFDRVATLGDAQIRRLYGNLAESTSRDWQAAVTRYALLPRQQYPLSQAKNAADIALVIDAMDILHGGQVDGVCIVSSDCDFTPLAVRMREAGKHVYLFGRASACEGYRVCCKTFFPLDDPAEEAAKLDLTAVRQILAALHACRAVDGWVALGELGSCLAKSDPPVRPQSHGARNLKTLLQKAGGFELKVVEGTVRVRSKAEATAMPAKAFSLNGRS